MTFRSIGLAGVLLLFSAGTLVSQDAIIATTTAESLNVRESPGGEVIAQLPRGTRVAVTTASDSWARIYFYARGEATELRQGWVSLQYLRRAPGGRSRAYGSECDSEYRSGAEVCLNVSDVSVDCDESYSGDYYRDCEVEIDYRLSTDYRGQSQIEVEVDCEARVGYKARSGVNSSESDSDSDSFDLYAGDSAFESMTLDVSFPMYKEVYSVELESADCEIDDLMLY